RRDNGCRRGRACIGRNLPPLAAQRLWPCARDGVQRARPFGGWHRLTGEFALRSGTRLFARRPLQITSHEASLGPIHGGAAYANAHGDLLVAGPASAASKICARLSLRDACLPPLSSALSSVRSIWLSSTR